VETIRDAQPRGPYFVGGWSAAGVVAYEIAQQLSAQGQEVALLVLFDAVTPAQFAALSPRSLSPARLRRVTQKLGFHWRHLRRGRLREAPGYLRDRLETIREDLKERAWRIRYALRLRSRQPIEAGLRDPDQVLLFTYRTYRPRPYRGRVVLFRQRERPRGHSWDPASGWRPLLGDRLEIHEVRGDHRTMFSESNVELLAQALRGCLDTSQGAPATSGERAGIPD